MKMWALIPMLAVLSFAGRAADSLEQIEAAMKKSWDGLTSLSMDSENSYNQSSEQFSMKGVTSGPTEMMKDGANWKMRSEMKGSTTQKIAGQPEATTTSNTLVVSDGVHMYSLTESNGVKQCYKMKVPPSQNYTSGNWVKIMRETYNLKVLPDETVDGAACWVIEATPKDAATQQGASTYYFTKSHGMTVKMETKGPDGKVVSSMTAKNVKINPSIPADRFVFTAPAGVTVIDQEAMMAQQQEAIKAAQAAQQQQAEPKKEETAKTEPAKTEEPAKKEETAAKKEEPKKEEKKKKKIGVGGF